VIWLIDFISELVGKLTTARPPSETLVVVPVVKLKLFAEPDLSFQTVRLLVPVAKVILDADLSAPSNQSPAVAPRFEGVTDTVGTYCTIPLVASRDVPTDVVTLTV
jgi:hypothetical protein